MIGDVLTSSILFEAIKHQYPNAQLHYVINDHTYPVVQGHPYIGKFHFFTKEHRGNIFKLLQFVFAIRRERFDVIIDVYSKLSSNLMTLFSSAQIKISKQKWYTSFIYNYTFRELRHANTNAGIAIENRLQLLQPINIDFAKAVKPKIYLTQAEKNSAKNFLEDKGINFDDPIFMISVLGSGFNKTYPFAYMAEVIDNIAAQFPKSQILFNYIPSQREQAKSIFDLCKSGTQHNIHFNIFGNSIREFLAISSYCKALIGNEGGAINMAKALDIKTFAIYSPWISKEVWSVFEDGKHHVSVHLKDFKPNLFKNDDAKSVKKNALMYYKEFSPNLMIPKLKEFLKNI